MSWQERTVEFAERYDLRHDVATHALDLVSEMGEVAKEILLASDYGQVKIRPNPNLAAELGDLMYSLCLLADGCDVDLEAALAATLQKYEARWQQKGHTGSN